MKIFKVFRELNFFYILFFPYKDKDFRFLVALKECLYFLIQNFVVIKVISLGRVDLIKGKLDKLIKQLRKYSLSKFVLPNEVKADTISMWGPVLLACALWEKIGIDNILERSEEEGKRIGEQNKYQEIKLEGRRVFISYLTIRFFKGLKIKHFKCVINRTATLKGVFYCQNCQT